MATTAAQKKAAKRRRAPIFFTVRRVILPETGEEIGALVPSTKWDRRTMRDRRFSVGTELRGDMRQKRNSKFWRLAHALGGFLADHVDGFEGLGQHDALKRLQELSGIGCEQVTYEIPNVGQLTRREAESLNFDDMDEGRFRELWEGTDGEGGWRGWLRREKFGGLDEDLRVMVEMMLTKENE